MGGNGHRLVFEQGTAAIVFGQCIAECGLQHFLLCLQSFNRDAIGGIFEFIQQISSLNQFTFSKSNLVQITGDSGHNIDMTDRFDHADMTARRNSIDFHHRSYRYRRYRYVRGRLNRHTGN
ncbi:hypothetical protein SDC9_170920 [bioreactor metagenome]|uniref:Uncharacterized protein n=1 Tax=bioreactor metagenome TaxID=1076179 RepID=A0A645G9E5_9ZZZZ